jgi:hypothetical protein
VNTFITVITSNSVVKFRNFLSAVSAVPGAGHDTGQASDVGSAPWDANSCCAVLHSYRTDVGRTASAPVREESPLRD